MENDLDITLTRRPSHHAFYTCGDLVKGSVILRRPTHARRTDVSIKFTGTAKSRIDSPGNSHQPCHNSEVLLFQYSKDLLQGRRSDDGQKYSWPFEFSFPSTTQSASTKERWSRDDNFHRTPGHPLPPTWPPGIRLDKLRFGCVSYALEVTTVNGVVKSSSRRHQIMLPFSQVRKTEHCSSPLSPITRLLFPSSNLPDPESHSSHQSVGSHSTAVHPTLSHFHVCIKFPQIICAGSKLPLFMGAEHDYPNSNSPSVPTILLKRLLVVLETKTRVRIPAGFLGMRQESQDSSSEKTVLADSGPLEMAFCDTVDVHSFIKDLALGDSLAPTFKTYNIALDHVLHVRAQLECAEKAYDLDMERGLFILPAVWLFPNIPTGSLPQVRPVVSPVDDPPPPYKDVETSTGRGLRGGQLRHFTSAATSTDFPMGPSTSEFGTAM